MFYQICIISGLSLKKIVTHRSNIISQRVNKMATEFPTTEQGHCKKNKRTNTYFALSFIYKDS